MKRTLFAALSLAALLAGAKTSTPAGWTDDLDAAFKKAKAEKKQVIVDFSGSDWCGWCKRLDEEVFDTEAFRTGAKDKYVLVMIDSPQDKSLLSEKAKEQNPGLVQKYGIRGFPSVLVFDGDGNKLFQTGYQPGGPEKYLDMLEQELRDAPDVAKYIAPIEKILQAPSADFEKACGKIQEEAMKKFKMPGENATKEEREKFMKDARAFCEKQFFEVVVPKFLPQLEKAVADANAVQVPERMAERKKDLIARSQSMLDNLKSELKKR